MADKFLQHEGIESGYFAKRKKQFNEEILKGVKSVSKQPVTVQNRKKTQRTDSKNQQPPAQKEQ